MNDKMLDLIGQADEEYLREAEGTSQMKIKHKRRLSAGLVAVIAAAMCLTSVGAVAAYKALNRDTVGEYYDSSAMDSMESRGYAVAQTVENEHFRLTVESVLRDKTFFRIMLSAVPLDDEAVTYMKTSPMISTTLSYKDDGAIIHTGNLFMALNDLADENNDGKLDEIGYEIGKPVAMVFDEFYTTNDSDNSRGDVKIDMSRSLNIRFESQIYYHKAGSDELFKGLEYNLGIPKEAKAVTFVGDDGNKVTISEFSVTYKYAEPVITRYKTMDTTELYDKAKIVFKDGRTLDIGGDRGYPTVDGFEEQIGDEWKQTRFGSFWRLNTLIDPDEIESFEFEGKTYKAK